jgi:hypothetical protein
MTGLGAEISPVARRRRGLFGCLLLETNSDSRL